MRAEELLETLTNDELKNRANSCFFEAEDTSLDKLAGPEEKLRLLTEADFYLKALIWRQDARIAERDLHLEKWVISLISVEIVLSLIFGFLGLWEGWKQGEALDRQVAVLRHMDESTAKTAKTLDDLQKAQNDSLQTLKGSLGAIKDLNTELTNETTLLSDAQKSLRAQLDLAKRQFEAQNRHPVLQVRAVLRNWATGARTTQVLEPRKVTAMNLMSVSDRDRIADFVLRNVGTADAVKIDLRVQPLSGVKLKCIDYGLLGGCDPQSAIALTLPPRPRDRPEVSNPAYGVDVPDFDGVFDLLVEVHLDVPKGVVAFGLVFSVGADGISPTRYDVQCQNPIP